MSVTFGILQQGNNGSVFDLQSILNKQQPKAKSQKPVTTRVWLGIVKNATASAITFFNCQPSNSLALPVYALKKVLRHVAWLSTYHTVNGINATVYYDPNPFTDAQASNAQASD